MSMDIRGMINRVTIQRYLNSDLSRTYDFLLTKIANQHPTRKVSNNIPINLVSHIKQTTLRSDTTTPKHWHFILLKFDCNSPLRRIYISDSHRFHTFPSPS